MIRSAVLTQITCVTSNSDGPDFDGPDFDGSPTNSPQDLVEKFNTVFTVENLSNLPTADKIFHCAESEKLHDILFDEAVVRK